MSLVARETDAHVLGPPSTLALQEVRSRGFDLAQPVNVLTDRVAPWP